MNWLKTWLSGKPHFVIGSREDPYMLRWFVLPRNRVFNIYLHKFLRDDDDRALHDHPWWFVSLVLKGGYFEYTGVEYASLRTAGSIAYRPATHRHRVALFSDDDITLKPCWTLVVTGRKARVWGFWCPKGFVPWFDFVDERDAGNVGRGCGEMS